MNDLATIPYGKFKRMFASLEKTLGNSSHTDEVPISYDYIVRSLFPEVYNDLVKKEEDLAVRKYIEGYNDGYKDCSDGKKQIPKKVNNKKKK